MKRPNLIRWIAYAYGARLPHEYQDWVKRDLTGPGAALRHLASAYVVYGPLLLALLALPVQWWIRLASVAMAAILMMIYTVSYWTQNRQRRLEKHGLPSDLISAKAQAQADRQREAYQAKYGH